jgi:hypothetical protein
MPPAVACTSVEALLPGCAAGGVTTEVAQIPALTPRDETDVSPLSFDVMTYADR